MLLVHVTKSMVLDLHYCTAVETDIVGTCIEPLKIVPAYI